MTLTAAEAEQRVLSLELFGMHFGLDRMRRLMDELGHPERAFRSVHVVGTNGKSSTVRMLAAILTRHGHHTGAYLSPHLTSFRERIRVDGEDIAPERFAAAVERALAAAERVNAGAGERGDAGAGERGDGGAGEGDVVTQFELLTAAAYSELADRGVSVAAIEAGLGGRYDATSVVPSEVQVLTGVALDHTRWLGTTIEAIAREKLEVVRPGGTLVLGPGLHPDADAVATEIATERGATVVRAGAEPFVPVPGAALAGFQRRNFAVACAAAQALLGKLDPDAVAAAGAEVRVPGRMQIVGERPLTVLDSAHNPDGIAALLESIGELLGGRRLVAVASILEDKDAGGMLGLLAPRCEALVLTACGNPRALPAAELRRIAAALGGPAVLEVAAAPHAAVARAATLAGEDGVVLATGSIYLVRDLLVPAEAPARPHASML